METKIRLFNPENPENDVTCLGEIWFLKKKLWKMALMLGFDFSRMDGLTTRGFTFSTITNPDKYMKPVIDFCEKHGIKYRVEYSENRWQKLVIVSQSKKVLEKLDALYVEFYRAHKTA